LRHGETIARWATRLAGSGVDAEDLVQDVFLVIHRQLPKYRGGEEKLPAWLFAITANLARGRRRREKFRRFFTSGSLEEGEKQSSPEPTPMAALETQDKRRLAEKVLDGMGERQRTLLILFELEGLSGNEIAELTGMKVATVWVNLHRARARFLAAVRELEKAEVL